MAHTPSVRRRLAGFLPILALAAAPARADSDVSLPAIPLRPGITADVHVKVYESTEPACDGHAVLAVHGVTHNAASWEPLARQVLGQGLAGQAVCRVIALDLPGHGGSGLPTGRVRFGNLRMSDYVNVLSAVLQRLPALGLAPDTVLGHSQGGLLVQLTQKALLARGGSLAQAGIAHAVLLTSVGPREVPWEFVDSGAAVPVLARFIRINRTLGLHVAIPDAAWPSVFFADPTGAVVGAPAPEDVARYNAPEPAISSLQLVGLGFPRPSVPAGVLAPERGTALTLIALENDSLIRPHEGTLLYEHLTGLPAGAAVIVASGPTSVHDMHLADPPALAALLAGARP
jgi:pimeloyl-ACP methyl ester carboxylesterase